MTGLHAFFPISTIHQWFLGGGGNGLNFLSSDFRKKKFLNKTETMIFMYLVFLPGFQFVTWVYRKRWSGEHPSFQEMKEPIGIMYMPVKNLILFNSAKFGDEWTAPRLDICHTRHQVLTEPKTSSCGSDVICNVLPSLV